MDNTDMRARNAGWLVVALGLVAAHAIAQTESASVLWQSRNITYNALASEFAGFWRGILTLNLEQGKVPTAAATVPAGRSISEVLREKGLFDGKDMPRQLDVLTCLLNSQVCRATPGKGG